MSRSQNPMRPHVPLRSVCKFKLGREIPHLKKLSRNLQPSEVLLAVVPYKDQQTDKEMLYSRVVRNSKDLIPVEETYLNSENQVIYFFAVPHDKLQSYVEERVPGTEEKIEAIYGISNPLSWIMGQNGPGEIVTILGGALEAKKLLSKLKQKIASPGNIGAEE